MGGNKRKQNDLEAEVSEDEQDNSGDESAEKENGEGPSSRQKTGQASRKRPVNSSDAPAKKEARKATTKEKAAIDKFVCSLIRAAVDGSVALFAVGAETRERYAHEGKSLLAIFEFLSKIDKLPPGTLQAVIDASIESVVDKVRALTARGAFPTSL